MYFRKWGRVSEITNRHLNALISAKTGFETEVVKTGNAGEHAMSMSLAQVLPYASGYAVEPQELVSIFENFSGILPTRERKIMEEGIDIFQIETRNPHLHEEKGAEHIQEMLLLALGSIYGSPLADNEAKQSILAELIHQGALKEGEEPPPIHVNPALRNVETSKFITAIRDTFDKYRVLH